MCGIAGMMSVNGEVPSRQRLQAMEKALRHRGPDGNGHYSSGDVGMVQTRLAIIDLATGDQPLYEPGGAALVANGEIYNYLELHAEVPTGEIRHRLGLRAAAASLSPQFGLDFPKHLRGMYAIALHDPAAGRLVLARDPFGIKPLYYAETAQGLVFASEPQSHPRRRRACRSSWCANRATSCCSCNSPPAATRSSRASNACCRARRSSSPRAASSSGATSRRCPHAAIDTDRRRRRRWRNSIASSTTA